MINSEEELILKQHVIHINGLQRKISRHSNDILQLNCQLKINRTIDRINQSFKAYSNLNKKYYLKFIHELNVYQILLNEEIKKAIKMVDSLNAIKEELLNCQDDFENSCLSINFDEGDKNWMSKINFANSTIDESLNIIKLLLLQLELLIKNDEMLLIDLKNNEMYKLHLNIK